jgi:hypothetical protein
VDLLFANSMRVKGDFGAKGLDQASDRLDTLKLSDAARRDYERYRNNASHYSSAIQTAIEEGEAKGEAKGEVKKNTGDDSGNA